MHNRLRIILITAFLVLFFLAFYGVLPITNSYWTKIIVSSMALGVVGFALGYMHAWQGFRTRVLFYLLPVVVALNFAQMAATQISQILRLPADQRYATMMRPVYLWPFCLIFFSCIACVIIGRLAFRQLHPGEAFQTFEEEQVPIQPNPILRNSILIVFGITALALIASFVFEQHSTLVLIVFSLALLAYISLITGWQWQKAERFNKRFCIAMAFIAPVSAFIGYYFCGKMQDTAHLVCGFKFAASIAFAVVLPAYIVIRIRRNS